PRHFERDELVRAQDTVPPPSVSLERVELELRLVSGAARGLRLAREVQILAARGLHALLEFPDSGVDLVELLPQRAHPGGVLAAPFRLVGLDRGIDGAELSVKVVEQGFLLLERVLCGAMLVPLGLQP